MGLSTWKEDSIAGIGETSGSALRNTIYLVIVCLGLHCYTQAFSSCSEQGLLSSCRAKASHCSGFCCRAQSLGREGSSNCGTWA